MAHKGLKPLRQQFSFEGSAVRLDPSGIFQPLRDATRCWVSWAPASYRMGGYVYEALYELKKDNSFVLLSFSSPYPLHGNQIIDCHEGVRGSRVDEIEAISFIVDGQFPITDDLQPLLAKLHETEDEIPEAIVQPRPLSFWPWDKMPNPMNTFAHDVRVDDLLPKLAESAIRCVQELRVWKDSGTEYPQTLLTVTFFHQLLRSYRVDPNRWWGDKSIVPPAYVDILQLPWPDRIDEVKSTTIPQLRELVVNAASLMHGIAVEREYLPPPTEVEKKLAKEHLIQSLGQIESNAVKLRTASEDLGSGKIFQRLKDQGPKHTKPPEDHELAAYMLLTFKLTNAEILERLKRTENAGTVSRWIKKVRDYIGSGNAIPKFIADQYVDQRPHAKSTATDPAILDMGSNGEGRTPRQKGKKKSE